MSKYPNEYAAWRVSFQSDRQAAERAFDDLIESAHEINQLDIELREYRRKLAQLHAAGLETLRAITGVAESIADQRGPSDLEAASAKLRGALIATESNK
jgi:hypothetical protein